ncbi:MAG: hypothetical protein L0211_15185, partial [Planctomycetaceae bacterium]|nr:hypothetical protein [Planctomycetaceae bacterium]
MQNELVGRLSGWAALAALGVRYGTFFGLIALAASWTVFGFKPRWTRIGQSLALIAMAVLAMLVSGLLGNMARGEVLPFAGAMSLVAIGQWLLIAGLLWTMTAPRRVRLCRIQDLSPDLRAREAQFGIRDLLIATGVTAALLAVIRAVLSQSWPSSGMSSTPGALLIFGYLAACNAFVTMPLLAAPLLRRFGAAATLLALAFVALVTVCELTAWFRQIGPIHAVHGFSHRVVVWVMNYSQAAWVLAALVTLRADGYRLVATAV